MALGASWAQIILDKCWAQKNLKYFFCLPRELYFLYVSQRYGMKIGDYKDYWFADTRPHSHGRKFPKTPDGKRAARNYLKNVEAKIARNGSFQDPARTKYFGSPAKNGDDWAHPNCIVAEYLDFEALRSRATRTLAPPHLDNKRKALEDIAALTYDGRPMARVRIGELKPAGIKKDIIPQLWTGRAHATASKKFVIFSHLLGYCVKVAEYITINPADVETPKKPVEFSASIERIDSGTLWKIIAAIESPKVRLAAECAAETGIRAGEQRAIEWADFTHGRNNDGTVEGSFTITKAVKKGDVLGPPKNRNAHRTVNFGSHIVAALLTWQMKQPVAERYQNLIFPDDNGGFANQGAWRTVHLHGACRKLGEPNIKWQSFRHYFASVLIYKMDETAATITGLMGHANLDFTLQQYGDWFGDRERQRIGIGNRISNAMRER